MVLRVLKREGHNLCFLFTCFEIDGGYLDIEHISQQHHRSNLENTLCPCIIDTCNV